ncbi:MAG TPA: type I methionyl aminopeptidase [Vicinamibacterales bacterium]|nr:type I methionyl aminopeptidase [Vicinamibacterales bacterium]
MSIESPADLHGMREVGRVVAMALEAMAAEVRPGITTGALDAIAEAIVVEHGARSAPADIYGFPRTVLISVNEEVVHGIPGDRRIARGDVVKLDVTLEKDGYVADAARTIVAGGGNALGARLAACAEAAFHAALAVARPGVKVNAIGSAVDREVRRAGFTVVRSLTGHGVGRTIHEEPSVPNYCNRWQTDVLTEGLVLTIEPIISAGGESVVTDDDGWTISTRDGSLAAHHEHTLMITATGPVILTASAA